MESVDPANINELIARGILTAPTKKRVSPVSWPEPLGSVPDEVMERLWREERENR